MSDKLSLQLGLRWEYLAPWAEQNGVEAAFDAATGKIGYNALPATMPAALVPLVHQQEGYFPDGILQKDFNNFGPRFGVAYNLTDRMVVRSGFGVYYDNLNLNELQFTRLIPPYYGQFSLNPTAAAPLQVDTLFPDLNNIPQFPAPFSLDPDNRTPYTMQWNVNFQRSLGRDYMVEAAYTGSQSRSLSKRYNINQADFGTTQISTRGCRFRSSSRRCCIQQPSERRSSRASRCASRSATPRGCSSLPTTSCRRIATTVPARSRRMTPRSGPISMRTRASRVITSAIAAPSASATSCHSAKGRRWLNSAGPVAYALGGWQVQGIVRAGSGFPFTLSGTNVCQCGSFVPQRVNYAPGREDDRGVLDNPTVAQWYDSTAYVAAGSGIPGHGRTQHADRAGLEAGGFFGQQALPDRRLATRVPREIFNLFNTTNFGQPDGEHQQRDRRRHLHLRRCAEHAVRHSSRVVIGRRHDMQQQGAKEASMTQTVTERGVNRRDFMSHALAVGGAALAASVVGPSAAWGAVAHKPLDPVNPDILFGSTSSLWSGARDLEWAIKRCAALGLQGIEPYAQQIEKYRSNPLVLKKLFDDAGLTMIDVSNGAKGQSTNFIDPAEIPKTIADARRVRARLSPAVRMHAVEVQHGRAAGWRAERRSAQAALRHAQRDRPADDCDGDTDGSASAYLGTDGARIRCAPRDGTDRSQIRLAHDRHGTSDAGRHGCGQDHERLFPAHRRGASQGHVRQVSRQHLNADAGAHKVASVYHNMGGGGVDFPAVFKVLRDRHFKGWAIFDMDGPRKGDDGFDAIGGNLELAIDDYLSHNVNYMRVILGIKLPPH